MADDNLHVPPLIGVPHLLHDRLRKRCHVHRPHLQGLPAHAREHQEVVDELAHPFGILSDPREERLPVGRQRAAIVLEQRLREAVDGAQRGAQVVRHGVAEALELGVRRLQPATGFGDLLRAGVHFRFHLLGCAARPWPCHARS